MKIFSALSFSIFLAVAPWANAQSTGNSADDAVSSPRATRRAANQPRPAAGPAIRAPQYQNTRRNFSQPAARQTPAFAGQRFRQSPNASLNGRPHEFGTANRQPTRYFNPVEKPEASRVASAGSHGDAGKWDRNGRPGIREDRNRVWRNHNGEGMAWRDGNRTDATFRAAYARGHREHHHRDWWRNRYTRFALVSGGCYYWDAGYWYPAYGYDPYYNSYAYDGPIYGYDGLPPDQVIASVQRALQEEGYYNDAVDGVCGPSTQQALAAWQQDRGLAVTAAIDRPTLRSLGFS